MLWVSVHRHLRRQRYNNMVISETFIRKLTTKRALHVRMSHSTVGKTTVSTKKTRLTLVK